MLFVELVMQGVGPFSGTTRISLKQGLNLVTGGNESGKTTLYNCLFSFLGAKIRGSQYHRDSSEASRAALIFKSRDGETCKAVQDYLKGQVVVFKFNPSSKSFDFLDKGGNWLEGFLRSESGGLGAEEIEQVFGLQYSTLLSLFSQIAEGSKTISSVSAKGDREETQFKEKRLKELREALKKTEELSQLEYQIDETQNKIHDLKTRLEGFNTIEDKLKAVSEELDELKDFTELPANIPELIAAYKKREEERAERVRRFEEEMLILEDELARALSIPYYKNKIFLTGGGITILSAILTFSMNLPTMFQPLYLVAFLLGLSMMGYTVFKEIPINIRRSEKEERLKTLKTEMRALLRKLEKDNAPFLEILKKTSSKDAADIGRRYRNYHELLEKKRMLEGERGRILGGTDKKAMEKEYQSLQAMREELRGRMAGYADMSANLYEIKGEIERLEIELGSRKITAENKRGEGPLADTMGAGMFLPDIKKMLGKDFEQLLPRIREEAQKNIQKLSSGKYERLDINDDSRISLYAKGKKEKIMPSLLSTGALSQLYLSLRIALFSVLSSRASIPLLLDDPLLSLDPRRQSLAVELLREKSKNSQIILLTSHNYPPGAGDHLVQL